MTKSLSPKILVQYPSSIYPDIPTWGYPKDSFFYYFIIIFIILELEETWDII